MGHIGSHDGNPLLQPVNQPLGVSQDRQQASSRPRNTFNSPGSSARIVPDRLRDHAQNLIVQGNYGAKTGCDVCNETGQGVSLRHRP